MSKPDAAAVKKLEGAVATLKRAWEGEIPYHSGLLDDVREAATIKLMTDLMRAARERDEFEQRAQLAEAALSTPEAYAGVVNEAHEKYTAALISEARRESSELRAALKDIRDYAGQYVPTTPTGEPATPLGVVCGKALTALGETRHG